MIEIVIILFIYTIIGLANSLAIIGLYRITKPRMILGAIQKIPFPEWIKRPLYDCPTCMASIHSFVPFWLTAYIITVVLTWKIVAVFVIFYLFYMLALAGLNSIIYNSFFGED